MFETFCASVEPPDTDIFLPLIRQAEWRGWFASFGQLTARRDELKTQLNISHEDVRRRKFTSPNFGVALQRVPLTRRNPADKHVRNATENQEENSRSVSVLFFLARICRFFLQANADVSVSIVFFFLPATTYEW